MRIKSASKYMPGRAARILSHWDENPAVDA